MRPIRSFISFVTFLALGLPALGAPAEVPVDAFRHAELHTLGQPRNLVDAFRDLARGMDGPAWVGYAVPRIPGGPGRFHQEGGHEGGCGTFYLEKRGGGMHSQESDAAGDAIVLLRVAGGKVERIYAVDAGCTVDAGGRAVHLYSGVDPRQSLELLEGVAADATRRLVHETLHAIAVHAEPAADDFLERVARGELGGDAAKQAVFWLGAARGQRGFEILRRLARSEDDPGLREKIAFAYYVSGVPEAVDALVDLARHDGHAQVRRQALFWLAQEAGQRAVAELEHAAEEDPDLDVKKHAIFAISQLPPDEGVPLLIRYARSHPHPAVRRQAMFWLGQSGDQRALDFFEDVLLERAP